MAKYEFLVIHCTATPKGRKITPSHIEQWHLGAKDLPDGKVVYKGKTYDNRSLLPMEKVGGIWAKDSYGRGWSKVGYSKIFFEDGSTHNFVEHNEDNWISSDEVTNGALGFNSKSKHFVYAGGLSAGYEYIGGRKVYKAQNTLTNAQEWELICDIKREIRLHPQIKVIGHNQIAKKECPSFDVREFCNIYALPKENIDNRRLKVKVPKITK